MKVKVFHLRLTKENLQSDQENLNSFMETVTVKKTSTELVNGQTNFWSILVFYDEQKSEKDSDNISGTDLLELTEEEIKIFEIFKLWRQDKAIQMNVPSFIVCKNKELISIAKERPQTLEDLLKIKGFGEQKIAKFGVEILALLNSI